MIDVREVDPRKNYFRSAISKPVPFSPFRYLGLVLPIPLMAWYWAGEALHKMELDWLRANPGQAQSLAEACQAGGAGVCELYAPVAFTHWLALEPVAVHSEIHAAGSLAAELVATLAGKVPAACAMAGRARPAGHADDGHGARRGRRHDGLVRAANLVEQRHAWRATGGRHRHHRRRPRAAACQDGLAAVARLCPQPHRQDGGAGGSAGVWALVEERLPPPGIALAGIPGHGGGAGLPPDIRQDAAGTESPGARRPRALPRRHAGGNAAARTPGAAHRTCAAQKPRQVRRLAAGGARLDRILGRLS